MGEAKRRAQLDPTFGIKPRKGHTRQMLKQLNREQLENLAMSLGLLTGQIVTQASNFIGDAENDGLGQQLETWFPTYVALKEQVETAVDWLEREDAA